MTPGAAALRRRHPVGPAVPGLVRRRGRGQYVRHGAVEPGGARGGRPGGSTSDAGRVHDDFRRLVLSRRSLLAVGGALAVGVAAEPLGPGGPGAVRTTGLSGQLALPGGWFNDAEVQLKWTVGGPHGYPPTGTVAGEPVGIQLTPSLTSRGLKVYTFKGRFGAAAMQCTVDFGADGDSFRANGSVGASEIFLTCASQPPGTKKWPVGGTIDGQAFALTVNTTGEARSWPELSAPPPSG